VINMLHAMGIQTGIDFDKMLEVARKVERFTGHPGDSSMLRLSACRKRG